MSDWMDIDVDKMQELLDRYHADILALNQGINQCIAEKAALEAENERLRKSLKSIYETVNECMREGRKTPIPCTWQVEDQTYSAPKGGE